MKLNIYNEIFTAFRYTMIFKNNTGTLQINLFGFNHPLNDKKKMNKAF